MSLHLWCQISTSFDKVSNNFEVVNPMFSAGSVSQYYTYSPFYHFVTGGTGTGKTLLIKALYETLVRQFDAGRNRDMTIPICNPLLRCHCVAQSMSVVLRDVHVVIIDKISMLLLPFVRRFTVLLLNETSWTLPNAEQYNIPGLTVVTSCIDGPLPTPSAFVVQ
ncbi:hypothetical protein FB192DRAFT_1347054 [Mucor lusitanicus]|uniref:Uncharacterized protein n=2 Tax=Mucor circinelloides f. lusitanicus TaxID=29924 RepID=A0A168KUJ9_MUCCL|nr:hypothetical protein FB192DRAFT_1347054 [Mucor lusitanicus]OAD02784.1 hypothetical protein MUCCIDRAFT_80809 [Mucor lusitanicus CBS 277.49]